MKTLYKVSATGAIQVWSIREISYNRLLIEWGIQHGAIQQQTENVEINQSGRTIKEQMFSRIESRVNKQKDRGYCDSIAEAHERKGLNAVGLLRPMLAKVYFHDMSLPLKDMFWQYKYNGHRCLITRRDDCLLAYSRNGKHIGTIDHIFDGLEIPEGATLDGELYIHNTPLQTISSIVRRKQPDNTKLKYIVYDTILDKRFEDRLDTLAKYKMGPDVLVAPTIRCPLREMLTKQGIHDEAHAKGFEGFMLRMNNKKYEPGKRSSQLLKVKQAFDIEVVVIGVEPSVDGWAILICKFVDKHGIIKTFRTPAPGTMRQKTEILHNKENYINKLLNVEFAEYTIDGIPFHPVATSFREEE